MLALSEGFAGAALTTTARAQEVRSAEADQKVTFNIPRLPLADALTELGVQSKLTVVIYSKLSRGLMAPPVIGAFSPNEALDQLLAHTGLRYAYLDPMTVLVTAPQTDQAGPERRKSRETRAATAHDERASQQEVLITGTQFQVESPVGAPLQSMTRDQLGSLGTIDSMEIGRTLPQVFGGGPNQDTHIGAEAISNSGLGVGVNLRGLGARATVVLVDGRRVAPSGSSGSFTDIANIPLTAIQYVSLLPYDATARYGADAVGGVVNFVMLKKLSGAETLLGMGGGTRGDLATHEIAQTLGRDWESGSGVISVEYFLRGPLPASDRRYAVSDLRPFGGGDFDTTLANPGNIIVDTRTWAIPARQDGSHLAAANFVAGTVNLQNQYQDADIIPRQERWNLYGTGRQRLSDSLSLFAAVLLGRRNARESSSGVGTQFVVPSTNPFYVNPTGGTTPIVLDYNFTKDLGPTQVDVGIDTVNATLGLDFAVNGSWTLGAYVNYGREKQAQRTSNGVDFNALETALADPNPLTAFNPFGDSSPTNPVTLDAIRTSSRFWLSSALHVIDVSAAGSVGQLPGGALRLAVGANHRDQFFATAATATDSAVASAQNLGRRVLSTFAELVVPLFGAPNWRPALRKLELSVAARYENYGGFGSNVTPKYGVIWSPLQGLAFRSTWGRSMRPPELSDLDESRNAVISTYLADSSAPGGQAKVLVWQGGNAALQDERATSWSTGLDFAPAALPGLFLGLTYFDTAFKDRIQDTPLTGNIIRDPHYAAIVTRNPTAAQIGAVCSHTNYYQGTAASCLSFPASALVDLRVRNLATLLTHGIDVSGAYERRLVYGKLGFGLSGTWIMGFSQANTPNEPLASILNTQNNPVDLRLRASTGWEFDGFGIAIAANFTDSYRDTSSVPQSRIDSWTTYDLQLHYEIDAQCSCLLASTRFELIARNIFNIDPPFLNNQAVGLGYDQENADPFGRILTLQVRKRW